MLYATVRQRKVFVKKPTTIVRNGVNVDTLVLEMDDEWAKMTSIKCIFSLQYTEVTTSTETVEKEDGETEEVTTTTKTAKEINKELLHTFGDEILVPWECLTETGKLSISCIGYVGDTQIMRTMAADSFWDVVLEGHDSGDEPLEATPTLYDQVISAAGAANAAATQATQVSNELTQKAESGEFKGNDGITPTVEIGTVQTGAEGSEAQVMNTGTFPNVILNFVLPRGSRGLTGGVGPAGAPGETPYIGGNGNWWIGTMDTGVAAAGRDGFDGEDGNGIERIDFKETTAAGNVYTVLLTNGASYEITAPVGAAGRDGNDGAAGVGIKNIVFKGNNDTGYVYTINLTDGTKYDFTAPRGPQGTGGGGGSGEAGSDGVGIQSIQLKQETATGNTYTILLTDGNSYDFTAPAGPVGKDGSSGSNGKDGTSVTVSSVSESTVDGGTNVVTFSDGKKLNVKNGSKGSDGAAGADGKTPVKGTDYFTNADKQEIAQAAAALVEVPDGFSGDYNDLKNIPSTFTPAAHNQAASTITSGTFAAARIPDLAASKITAGTFAGQVVANASGQDAGSYVVRNSKISASEETPTVNGQICWKYK